MSALRDVLRKIRDVFIHRNDGGAEFYADLYFAAIGRNPASKNTAEVVVFSMDRAMQLHALLSSYFDRVSHPVKVNVLYRVSNQEHETAYREVFEQFSKLPVRAILQEGPDSFRRQVIGILKKMNTERVFFLVDDNIFVNPFDLSDFLSIDTRDFVPSLRLGNHLRRCYTMDVDQSLPAFVDGIVLDPEKLVWTWEKGEYDWGYPLSVDGHLFDRSEFLILLENTEFRSPNTLEGNLQVHSRMFRKRWGIAYKTSKLVNVPWNKVQKDNENLHGDIHQDELLRMWREGLRIDVKAFYGLKSISCHQELDAQFKRES